MLGVGAGAVLITGAAAPALFVGLVPGAIYSSAVGISYVAGATLSGIGWLNCYRYLFGPDQCLFSGGIETCVYATLAAAIPFGLGRVGRYFGGTVLRDSRLIGFSQDSIRLIFKDGRSVRALINQLRSGAVKPTDLPVS